jgi:hypothetical protein
VQVGQEGRVLAPCLGRESRSDHRLGRVMLPGARARIGSKPQMESLVPAGSDPPRFIEPCFDLCERVLVPAFGQGPTEMDPAKSLPQQERLVFRKPQRFGR